MYIKKELWLVTIKGKQALAKNEIVREIGKLLVNGLLLNKRVWFVTLAPLLYIATRHDLWNMWLHLFSLKTGSCSSPSSSPRPHMQIQQSYKSNECRTCQYKNISHNVQLT